VEDILELFPLDGEQLIAFDELLVSIQHQLNKINCLHHHLIS
jgi:hypothetical protein